MDPWVDDCSQKFIRATARDCLCPSSHVYGYSLCMLVSLRQNPARDGQSLPIELNYRGERIPRFWDKSSPHIATCLYPDHAP